MKRSLLMVATLSIAAVVAPSPGGTQAQPPTTLEISPTQGPVGTVIDFTVTNCASGGRVFFLFGNFGGGSSINPAARFSGDPAVGTLEVPEPPYGFREYEVIADCEARPGLENEETGVRLFNITGPAPTTGLPTPTTRPPASPPVGDGPLDVSDTTVRVGDQIVLTGGGYRPDEPVTVVLYSDPVVLTTVAADGSGALDATVTIPVGAETGPHLLVASGADQVLTATIEIEAAAADAPGAVAPPARPVAGRPQFTG